MKKIYLICCLGLMLRGVVQGAAPADEIHAPYSRIMSGCAEATSRTNIAINTIRFSIFNGGDRWPYQTGGGLFNGFEVPKMSGKSLSFGGSLWIAAKDGNDVLHTSAQTYRQTSTLGISFWPGPLGIPLTAPDSINCREYDKIWQLTKQQIEQHRQQYSQPGYQAPADLLHWPAHGNAAKNHAAFLAPFADLNGNLIYEPQSGEYPLIAGDEATWHIYNDLAGGINGSGSVSMGLEIQEENFAYAAANPLERTAFVRYKIINRSAHVYDSVYFGLFSDPDIGSSMDDFIGCDVGRNLGYAYNSANDDATYGINPPAFGILQLEGPFAIPNDGIDNNRDGQTDEVATDCNGRPLPERIAMTSFIYFNNDATQTGNPRHSRHVMQYLTAQFQFAYSLVFGGNGVVGQAGGSTNVPYSFAFPGNSDPQGWGYVYAGGNATTPPFEWTESSQTGLPILGDRRFVMGNGATRMLPGDIHILTYAGIWARDSASTDSLATFNALLATADFVRAQYDSCFLSLPNVLVTSQKQQESAAGWIVYPNPVNNNLVYVRGDFDGTEPVNIRLIDMQGREKAIRLIQQTNRQLDLVLDGAAAGLYLLEIRQGNRAQQQKLFVTR